MHSTYVSFSQFGPPQEVLTVNSQKYEMPKYNEVLIRMLARPINPSDLMPIYGSYAHRIPLPNIPGYEGVGMIEEVGEHVDKSFLGKRVLALRGEGTWPAVRENDGATRDTCASFKR